MCEIKRIKDYLNLSSIGFFQRIDAKLAAQTDPASPPWSPYITSAELDSLYYLNHKRKIASDWWEDMEGDTDTGKDAMASMLWGIYGVKWSHLFEIFEAEYNPLENYDRLEDITETTTREGTETTDHSGSDTTSRELARTGQDTDTRTPDLTKTLERTGSDTDVRTPDLTKQTIRDGQDTETRTPDLTTTSQTTQNDTDTTNKRAAFNSTDPVVTDTSKVEQKDNRTDKQTGTDETVYERDTTDTETESGTERLVSTKATTDTETQEGTETIISAKGTTDTEDTTLTRDTSDMLTRDTTDTLRRIGRIHGNIGVTTAAQMMTGDKEAWDSLKLIEGMLMDDINEQLTLPIY